MREQRRSSGTVRVPFVRRCTVELEDGGRCDVFLVNINTLGTYVAADELPRLGLGVTCRLRVEETSREIRLEGVVAWTNPRQQHPVHSLPAGFGVSFRGLSDDARAYIEKVVGDYLARRSGRP
jgi:Tfp pilus assembly protein PilZ